MWHRKTEQKSKTGTGSAASGVSRPFGIRSVGTTASKQNTSASAARRSRDPPQAMNLSAFLRSITAASKDDLHAENRGGDEEGSEYYHDGSDNCSRHSNAQSGDSEDDNLHELMVTLEEVDDMCDMLERCAHVSSEDDGDSRRTNSRDRRKARKTETVEIYTDFDAEGNSEDNHSATGEDGDHAGEGYYQHSVGTTPLATSGAERGTMPALVLHTGGVRLCPRVRRTLKVGKSRGGKSTSGTSEDELSSTPALSSTSTTIAKQRRRDAQRLMLRRSLSGRFTRKASSADALLNHLAMMPHARTVKTKRTKRSRSASKKELPDTPRSHTEEVVIRKAIESANRRYLIPRLPRLQHFNLHVVLDLDETLVSARNGPILVRPYVGHLMKTLMDLRCEVILWTAGIPQYVAGIIAGLTMAIQGLSAEVCEQVKPPWMHHLIQRNDRWYDEDSVCVKNLKLLGRPLERVLIIENNPAAVQLQISNAVLVQDYSKENYNDRSLEVVSRIVSRCARSIEPVYTTLAADPELVFVEFDLIGEHSVTGKPIRPVEYGLRYTPAGGSEREYAGESPSAVFEMDV